MKTMSHGMLCGHLVPSVGQKGPETAKNWSKYILILEIQYSIEGWKGVYWLCFMFGNLICAIVWVSVDLSRCSCLVKGIENFFKRNVFNWLDTFSILSPDRFISKKREINLVPRLLGCRSIWVSLDLVLWSCLRRSSVDLFNRNDYNWPWTVGLGK